MPNCPNCNKEIDEESSVCSYCGESINKHPVSGYVSVALTLIGFVMLLIFKSLGIVRTDDAGLSVSYVAYLFVSMTFAIIGIFSGVLGIAEENSKKIFPVIGLLIGAICVVILIFIVAAGT